MSEKNISVRFCLKDEVTDQTVEVFSDNLASALASALEASDHVTVRLECVIAEVIEELAAYETLQPRHEFWDGYSNAVNGLLDSAAQIVRGWRQHDLEKGVK